MCKLRGLLSNFYIFLIQCMEFLNLSKQHGSDTVIVEGKNLLNNSLSLEDIEFGNGCSAVMWLVLSESCLFVSVWMELNKVVCCYANSLFLKCI